MDTIIRAENLSFGYEGAEEGSPVVSALKNINLNIEKGSFTAIIGRNGSGKSTFAKNVNGLLLPTGGAVYVKGMDTSQEELIWEIRKTAGMVFQNPDNQIVAAIVEDDVAFGPENLGIPTEEIRLRIDDAMKGTGIYHERHKAPGLLSGGQKQRVAIAGVLAMKPECIIFDEPTAMLDPKGRSEVMSIIEKLHEEGITVLLITHFMEEAARSNRIIIMNNGKVISDGTPAEIFSNIELIESAGLDVPAAVKIREELKHRGINIPAEIIDMEGLADFLYGLKKPGAVQAMDRVGVVPLTDKAVVVRMDDKIGAVQIEDKIDAVQVMDKAGAVQIEDKIDAVQAMDKAGAVQIEDKIDAVQTEEEDDPAQIDTIKRAEEGERACQNLNNPYIIVENLTHVYNPGLPDETLALDDVSFSVEAGQFVGIIGHTGSGKSTLVQHMNGLLKASSGRICVGNIEVTSEGVPLKDLRRCVGLVFQYPEYQLFEESVELDVAFGPKNLGLSEEAIDERVRTAMSQAGLDFDELAKRSPFELSGGQKRRAAIAGILAMRPEVLILDEPAAGLDPQAHRDILDMISRIRRETGCTVILVSHNMNDVAQLCDKVLVMNHGKLVLSGSPVEVFRQDKFLKSIDLGLPSAGELIYMMKERGAAIHGSALDNSQAADIIKNFLLK